MDIGKLYCKIEVDTKQFEETMNATSEFMDKIKINRTLIKLTSENEELKQEIEGMRELIHDLKTKNSELNECTLEETIDDNIIINISNLTINR